jgi:hypothetical protein
MVARRSVKGKSKLLSLPACLGGLTLCVVLAAAAAFGGYTFLAPGGRSTPLVLIHAPQNGEHLLAGQPITVQAVANDPRKVVRVELWADGQLLDSQASNVPGGISSFPLLADWEPASAGGHTIMVRAFNSAGARDHSTISVSVVADRDGDGVADEADTCPDQPGLDISGGCPDRDVDGTPDSADACPDTAGLPEADGCAAAGEGDRDGDGSPDAADVCPDTPGSSLSEGCPDADGDFVPDSRDACVGEAGPAGSDGCPTAGDADGDGVPDSGDVCPAEWGLAEHGGCPEVLASSGDGVVLGTGMRDSDGDGASDDVDPCPAEAGSPENGYCPPPEAGPGSSDGGPDLSDILPGGETISALVEFEALHFEVSEEYGEVWCYAQLADGDMERYDFAPSGERQWDIAQVLGGENSVHLGLAEGEPVGVFVECFGSVDPADMPAYLGSTTRQHVSEEWDGHVIAMDSVGGDGGRSFQVRYHLCASSCDETALQSPIITGYVASADRIHLDWEWEGDRSVISGFKLYLNGNLVQAFPRDVSDVTWLPPDLACVDSWELYLTAFSGPVVEPADIESPPGNSVVWEDLPCQERIRVTFQTLNLHHPPADDGGFAPGPLYGGFAVSAGAGMENLRFDGNHCLPLPFPPHEICLGLRLGAGTHSIQGLFDEIRSSPDACYAEPCLGVPFSAPATDTITISANPGDEITIAAHIRDADAGNPDDTLFREQVTLNVDDLPRDSTLAVTIPGAHADLIVLVDRFPFDP